MTSRYILILLASLVTLWTSIDAEKCELELHGLEPQLKACVHLLRPEEEGEDDKRDHEEEVLERLCGNFFANFGCQCPPPPCEGEDCPPPPPERQCPAPCDFEGCPPPPEDKKKRVLLQVLQALYGEK